METTINNDNNVRRIFQPNLSCKFVLNDTPDLMIRSLFAVNRDGDIAIDKAQQLDQVFSWLMEIIQSKGGPKKVVPKEMPQMDIFWLESKKGSSFTLIFVSNAQDIGITDAVLITAALNWCDDMAKRVGITLGDENVGIKVGAGLQPEV